MAWCHQATTQAITWANVDPDLCRHMASLDHNELIKQCISQNYPPADFLQVDLNGDAYISQLTGSSVKTLSSLVQVISCNLCGTKPLSETLFTCCSIDPPGTNLNFFRSNQSIIFKKDAFENVIWKMAMQPFCSEPNVVTNWGRNKMATILQTRFPLIFSYIKMSIIWNCFWWIIDEKSILVEVMAYCHQAQSNYVNQGWPSSMCHMASPGLNELISTKLFYFCLDIQSLTVAVLHRFFFRCLK